MKQILHMRWVAALLITLAAHAVAVPKEKDKEKGKGKVEVSVTAPAANASFTAPAAIAITAHAISDRPNHPIAKVEFFQGSMLLGTASAAPYTFTWANAPAGNFVISATATNNKGDIATSGTVAINVNAPPTVQLTAPANNASYTGLANITLTANAADVDGNIAKVEFYQGSALLGTATAAPYSINWASVSPGNYQISARATDNQGATATSTSIAINVNAPPAVTLTAPANNASYIVPTVINLTSTASDADGSIAKVEFFSGTTLLGTVTQPPYNFTWTDASPANHSLTVKATDNQGASTISSPVVITVVLNQLPTVSLSTPTNDQQFIAPAGVLLNATASDADGTVTKVEFYQGSALIATVTDAPFMSYWTNVPVGSYSLRAKTFDNLGGTATSAAINITVVANAPPSITINATPSTAVAPASINLTASATDADGSVAKVEFFNGAVLLATVTQAPYSYSWTNVSEGSYSISARAIDNLGGVTTSNSVTVTVTAASTVKQPYFIETDHLNTPRVITNSSNQIVWRWDNTDPFGNNVPDENPSGLGPFIYNPRFDGQYYDRETGLHYNYFRDCYDPATGRYCQSDPIGLAGGLNTYAYVEGNPLSYTDPLGLMGQAPGRGPYPTGQGPGTIPGLGVLGAMGNLGRNYGDMRRANTIGADKYFHCKANCEAAKRGKEGQQMACLISDTREWFDQNVKGGPASASAADQAANHYGRNQGASSTQSCEQICQPYRPTGLPANY